MRHAAELQRRELASSQSLVPLTEQSAGQPARMEMKKSNNRTMLALLDKVNASASSSAPKPLTARTPSMPPPPSIRPTPTATALAMMPTSTPFEDMADDHYGGESYDPRYLESQTYRPQPTKPLNRTFADSDPIESASQPAKPVDVDEDDDDELPDAVDFIKSDKERHDRSEKLRQLKLKHLEASKPPPQKGLLAASSSDDDVELLLTPATPPEARSAILQHQRRGGPAKREHIVRTESQLNRAGNNFGISKRGQAVTHPQLIDSLEAQIRRKNVEARLQKEEDFVARGGRMRAEAQPATQEDAVSTDIAGLLERERAAGAGEGDDAEDADDDDFNPDAPEADEENEEMGSGSEPAGSGAEEEDEDEMGSADEAPNSSPAKSTDDAPAFAPVLSDSPSKALPFALAAPQDLFFADMKPIERIDRGQAFLLAQAKRAAEAQARPAATQSSGDTDLASPTQIVEGPDVIVPFHPGFELDLDAFGDGGAGFSQLFEEEETVRFDPSPC